MMLPVPKVDVENFITVYLRVSVKEKKKTGKQLVSIGTRVIFFINAFK